MAGKKYILAILVFAAFACAASAFDIDPATMSVSTKSAASPGQAIVSITADPSDAWISVDGSTASFSTWSGNLAPGSHIISAWAKDYYPAQFSLTVVENTKYTVNLELEPHTGYLILEISPADAAVFVDGQKVQGYMVEIPVGKRTVSIRKFGYDEQKFSLVIQWQRTSILNVNLSPSAFEIREWKLKPEVFNPSNKGLYGRSVLSFTITAPGRGRVKVIDSSGMLYLEKELPVFTTWSQRFAWDGRDDTGKILPDGEYLVALSLWPFIQAEGETETAEGQADPEPSIVFTTKLRIDSSSFIVPSGAQAARPGLLYFPDPKISSLLPGSAELLGTYPRGGSLALGFKLGSSTMLALEGSYDVAPAMGFALSFMQGLGSAAGMDFALLGRFAWNSAAAPEYPGAGSEAEISLPLAYSLGGLRFGIAPGLVYDFSLSSFKGRAGLGLWYENQSIVAGLSAQSDIGSVLPMTTTNPLHLGLETRILLDSTPLSLMLRISGDFNPSLSAPAASLGFGVAW
ncbi:MAG: hypothetical protein RBT73_00380 [Spirochaetia bacterium]|jgi:hypothetical protein|nr:hypothetical protein [Spirochaetia bacterium]